MNAILNLKTRNGYSKCLKSKLVSILDSQQPFGFQTVQTQTHFLMCLKTFGFGFQTMSEIQSPVFQTHKKMSEIGTHNSSDFRQAKISDIYCTTSCGT